MAPASVLVVSAVVALAVAALGVTAAAAHAFGDDWDAVKDSLNPDELRPHPTAYELVLERVEQLKAYYEQEVQKLRDQGVDVEAQVARLEAEHKAKEVESLRKAKEAPWGEILPGGKNPAEVMPNLDLPSSRPEVAPEERRVTSMVRGRKLPERNSVPEWVGRRRQLSGGIAKPPQVVQTAGVNAPTTSVGPTQANINGTFYRWASLTAPASVNWTATGAMTQVHAEGPFCQSCWAIATADAISIMSAIANGMATKSMSITVYTWGFIYWWWGLIATVINPLDIWSPTYGSETNNLGQLDMSPQQLGDCSQGSICEGGWPEWALMYASDNGGLAKWSDYPYTMRDGTCNLAASQQISAQITGYEIVPARDTASFKKAVAQTPIIAFIASSDSSFGAYKSGVYLPKNCSKNLDHVVLITGYGTDPTYGPYWIIKNSWGPYWGENGYMRIGMVDGDGLCGITSTDALYPVNYPTSGSPCNAFPNPCGAGTCFVQTLLTGPPIARCSCPSGFVENTNVVPSMCIPSNPCSANPNPCGSGTCNNNADGSISCSCPSGLVIGSTADGTPTCVSGYGGASGSSTYSTQTNDTCASISAAYGLTPAALMALNKWLNCTAPIAAGSVVSLGVLTVFNPCSSVYVTQATDTCKSVAALYGISTATLSAQNPMVNCSHLLKGTEMCMYAGQVASTASAAPIPVCGLVYNVQSGDTCSSVAATVGISQANLVKLNPGISCTSALTASMTLCVANSATGNSTVSSCTKYYKVVQGDKCPTIWNMANLTQSQFMALNPGLQCTKPYFQVGQIVCIGSNTILPLVQAGVPYSVMNGDTLNSIAAIFEPRCGLGASAYNISLNNGLASVNVKLTAGQVLNIPCPPAGNSDPCGCPYNTWTGNWWTDTYWVCGYDGQWYYSQCDASCYSATPAYSSCTTCATACAGRTTLGPNGPGYCGTTNGACYPIWSNVGSNCQGWRNACWYECGPTATTMTNWGWSGGNWNTNFWNCYNVCKGGC